MEKLRHVAWNWLLSIIGQLLVSSQKNLCSQNLVMKPYGVPQARPSTTSAALSIAFPSCSDCPEKLWVPHPQRVLRAGLDGALGSLIWWEQPAHGRGLEMDGL